jgi:hypothetical protein
MRQAINSIRKSEMNDCTENISDKTFKQLTAVYFIPEGRIKWEIRITLLQSTLLPNQHF